MSLQVTYGTHESSRKFILEGLSIEKSYNKNYKVLDVGGFNSWSSPVVDCVIDLLGGDEIFDINEEVCWENFERIHPKYDYAICTHTLEDIYNPFIALKYLPRVAKEGIITMPSINTELSRGIEGYGWLGYCHHRYLFWEEEQKIHILPKLPILESIVKSSITFNKEIEEIRFHWKNHISFEYPISTLGPGWGKLVQAYEELIGSSQG